MITNARYALAHGYTPEELQFYASLIPTLTRFRNNNKLAYTAANAAREISEKAGYKKALYRTYHTMPVIPSFIRLLRTKRTLLAALTTVSSERRRTLAIYLDYDAAAFALTETAASLLSAIVGFYPVSIYNFLYSLATCKRLENNPCGQTEKERLRATLSANQKWLGERAADAGSITLGILHYVDRTGQTLALDNAPDSEFFMQDAHIMAVAPKSVL